MLHATSSVSVFPAPEPVQRPAPARRPGCPGSVVAALLGLAFLWSYWTTLAHLREQWSMDPHAQGFLVPVFSLVILWLRRPERCPVKPSWWGLLFLLPAACLRLFAAHVDIVVLDVLSILPALVGVVLLVGGWGVLRWSWPAIGFLIFMVPLPFQLHVALAQPLRDLDTAVVTYALQTLGYPAVAEGHVIFVDHLHLRIIDACSGVNMLVTFFSLATALALVLRTPLWDRLTIVVSAIPIAVLVNFARITVIAMAYYGFDSEGVRKTVHDLAGWLMMPAALALLWLELRFLDRLLLPVPQRPAEPLSPNPGGF